MDDHVLAAIAGGVRQVVICGAGLDDRALRFRASGVRFFEVDHPVTQADKAARLRDLGAPADGPVLIPCDLQTESVAMALAAAGHDQALPTLFLCEGLLVYLDVGACERLLADLAACAADGSTLAVTLSTYSSQRSAAEVIADANARRRTAATEPWRTILRVEEHLSLLAAAGWAVTATADSPAANADVTDERRSLLVTARPARAARDKQRG